MNIEDFITTLAMTRLATYNSWDEKLIYSFSDQINRGSGFTEKQSVLALKIVKRHSGVISSFLKTDITPYLENPNYRYPIRKVTNTKEISVVEDPTYGKLLKVIFPYNEQHINEIRKVRDNFFYAQWNKEEKAWNFALCEESVSFLSDLMTKETFTCDEEFTTYALQVRKIKNELENYVPMLVSDQNGLKFVNIPPNLPKLESKDIISALFEARKRGIVTWDTTISDFLSRSELNNIVKDFLKTDPGEIFTVNSETVPFSALADIIKFMGPCVFVIPGGSELEKLKFSYYALKEMGIEDKEMSVMFRLPSSTHDDFNKFVKNNELNSPISENTRVVFISSKLPKPVLKSKIKFNSVINLGHGSVHYTMRDFVTNHENLVVYAEKSKQKVLNFGNL